MFCDTLCRSQKSSLYYIFKYCFLQIFSCVFNEINIKLNTVFVFEIAMYTNKCEKMPKNSTEQMNLNDTYLYYIHMIHIIFEYIILTIIIKLITILI